jgi:hypothetical protein
MVHAVARNLVALVDDASQQRGMGAHHVAQQEEGRPRVGGAQEVEDLRRAAVDDRFGVRAPLGFGDELRVEPVLDVE